MISIAKLQRSLPAAVGEDETMLSEMITRAQAFIEVQTRRYFGLVSNVTEYLSGNGSRHLRLAEPVVPDEYDVAIDLVEERDYPGGTATEITDTEYATRDGGNTSYLVRLGGYVWTTGKEYAVTYDRGYPTDEGPPDIEQLVIDLIALRLKFRGLEGMRSETIGGYSYTRFGDGDLDSIDGAWTTIKAWRRLVFA